MKWSIELVKSYMEPHRNEENAVPMAAYMKNLFPFLGIKTPERRMLFRALVKENELPSLNTVQEEVWALFQLKEREYHYIAIELLAKYQKQLTIEDLPFCLKLIETNSWWDSVDAIAPKIVGDIVKMNRVEGEAVMMEWAKSENMWTNRASILHQLKYKQETNEELLFATINRHATSKEFFIQKAIGWVLREYAKTSPEVVRQFVENTKLAPLSKREALKHMK
ncbi:DNA alkylation repair protein [Psychrobacillus sp. NEAU-3TGS]|uniref:DNA alkylation repair protein n=1 Tax=Psychrobacillus sp. NEAU-3TGS TaxID=2995412 RepID=UPI0024967B0E|nr:DNA alkylation repair protein [Psychrobacillus sp. NEAU-3TGS]MDI2586356.1 DNA alkylation repair protein [Psychrobacillus sp. NEAU-3TGS]